MMQVGTNQSTTYHSQPALSTSGGQTGRSSSTSRQQQQQQQSQYDNEQTGNIRPRLCILRKWPHYDGYGVHLARNQHWLGLRIGDVEPNSPAESGGLLREDVVLAVNGRSVENEDFFVILSFIQHELEDDQIRFLVLDPQSADVARRYHLNIDENYRPLVRMETPVVTVSPEKILYEQWRASQNVDPTTAQNTIHLGPGSSSTYNQNQINNNFQRYQEASTNDGRDDVYTFLPYSDRAVENGRSFFDVLFDQDNFPYTNEQHARHTIEYSNRDSTGDYDQKDKKLTSTIKDGVKNLVKSGVENIKSIIPKHDEKDKSDNTDTKRKNSRGSLDSSNSTNNYQPSTDEQNSSKYDRKNRSSLPKPTNQQQQQQPTLPYERLWDTSSELDDTNNNLRSEPRQCSLSLRPGIDPIGISLQPDKDFGHIIKQVEPNTAADRAGIERDDVILSLNGTRLLNVPYDDVLKTIRTYRNEPNLDFLVAKKSYLLKSRPNNTDFDNQQYDARNTAGEVMPSSNIAGSKTLKQLYDKYNNDEQPSSYDDRSNNNLPKGVASTTTTITTTITDRPDQRSSQLDNDQYASKQQPQQQGQIYQGVGPATGDQPSWGGPTGKSTDDIPTSGASSIRSTSRNRRPDTDDTKGRGGSLEESFKPLQVGITNPTASQQSDNVSSTLPTNAYGDDGQGTSRPTSLNEQRDTSPNEYQGLDTGARKIPVDTGSTSIRGNQVNRNVQNVVPIAPTQTSSTKDDYEQQNAQTTETGQPDLDLGTTKVTNVTSKPIKAKPAMNVYDDDTDDDDLSDITETSREEEDTSETVANNNRQTANTGLATDKKDATLTGTSTTSKPGLLGSTNQDDSRYSADNPNQMRGFTSTTIPDREQSISPTTGEKQVVNARRLEESDSEDATSAADSQTRQSAAESFYSAGTSVEEGTDTDQQERPDSADKAGRNTNIKTTRVLGEGPHSDDENEDEDEEEEERTSDEETSTEEQHTPIPVGKMALATMPLSELENYGYELHELQLMQPTETSPVGLKLTKQQDPLQYIITAVAKGTKADLAGLKVNDWLIKIEDNDVRLVEFSEVSQDIRQLLTNAGLINMVIARKKSSGGKPKSTDNKQATPTTSRQDSLGRQQGEKAATSVLTTDITRDTPNNSQVRFTPDQSKSPPRTRTEPSSSSNRDTNTNAPGGPLSVGITNPISDDNQARTPRSQSRSPTRADEIDPNDIRHVVLKEALGLDFNSFIPEGDSLIQTHFISNVQSGSIADKAGLRDGDRILTVNGVDVTNSIHEDVRRMMQSKKPLQLTVVNDPKYIELIENVKRNQDQTEDSNLSPQKSDSPKPVDEDLAKYQRNLFNDDQGTVQVKHCLLKKDPTYNGYGLLLRYQNGLHLIDQVEEDSPAYNAGLREDDVILYVDKKNVEQMTHDDVKILIRKLSLANTNIDLILIKKSDMQRYKNYQERNTVDWKPILQDKLFTETNQTVQSENATSRTSNDQTNTDRKSSSASSASGKQQAPIPPPTQPTASPTATASTNQPTLAPGTRLCILQPSADRTAGFALSGKSPPPYIICQIEKNSPAEKAGLLLNDALLSINGVSVTEKSYDDTVKLIKEALKQKSIELVVREPTQNQDRSKVGSQSTLNDQGKSSSSSYESNVRNNDSFGGGNEPSRQGSNAVEEYQKQRNKELSYTLRLCHLHPTNGDGTQAATFGFELGEESDYEYPIILRVDPQSSAEGAGLQSRDILLKINERKTKGLGYEKVKKEIEKAKRDGRLEMLVVDQETYEYCKRAKKPLKEPEMRVRHIFPKSRSSASFHKLPIAAVAAAVAATSSVSSQESVEQLNSSNKKNDDNSPTFQQPSAAYRLSTPKETDSENEEEPNQSTLSEKKTSSTMQAQRAAPPPPPTVNFDLHSSPPITPAYSSTAQSQETPLKFFDPAQSSAQQRGATSSTDRQNVPSTAQSTPSLNQTSTKESKGSKRKAIPNAINSLFNKIGHSKSSKRS